MSASEARLVRNTALHRSWRWSCCGWSRAAYTPLTFDEAYYWTWSKHLAGGYYDHPPMVAVADPARHADRGRYRTRRAAGVDPAGAADELCGVSQRGDSVRRPAGGGDRDHPAQRHADGGGRHHDRHAGCAAAGGLQFCAVLSGKGSGDRARRVVARGRRRRRRGAVVEIHRAVFRPGDPDLADRGAKTAALAALAVALSRRHRRVRDFFAGDFVERRSPMGVVHQAARPRAHRGFYAALYRRVDPDPDRVRDAAGVHSRRDGAVRIVEAQGRRVRRAGADQFDVLDHHAVFCLAFAAQPASRPTGSARSIRPSRSPRPSPPTSRDGAAARSASSISACAGRRRRAS